MEIVGGQLGEGRGGLNGEREGERKKAKKWWRADDSFLEKWQARSGKIRKILGLMEGQQGTTAASLRLENLQYRSYIHPSIHTRYYDAWDQVQLMTFFTT